MVTSFSTDYMHCVLLGVMRKLLNLWMCRKNSRYKLSIRDIESINNRMMYIKYIPSQFARKPRTLYELDRWKATEFRLFVLYIGKIVVKGILKTKYYKHFIMLNHAIAILISVDKSTKIEELKLAKLILIYFVKHGITLYGKIFPVYKYIHYYIYMKIQLEQVL